jgi:hypothetical protein
MCLSSHIDIFKALKAVYPDYAPTTKPRGYWRDKQHQKEFFDRLAVKWNIQKPEDWNKVTHKMLIKEGGNWINHSYNSSLQQGKTSASCQTDI